MPVFRGVGERIRQRLRETGYTRPNGDLRVADFCMDHRFNTSFVYDWMADRRTPLKELERLATALETTPAWLCFGVSEVPTPSAAPAKAAASGGARRPATALAERRQKVRRRHQLFPDPLPDVARRPRSGIMLGFRSTRRVPRAA